MSFASKFNRSAVTFNVDTTDFGFCSLKYIAANYKGGVFKVLGFYISNKSAYGIAPVLIIENAMVNLPEHTTASIQAILNDSEAVEIIKRGEVGFKVREYISKNPKAKGKKCYSIDWVDITPDTATTVVEVERSK